MTAVALKVAYDGADFAGFQRQTKVRTVQGELEAAIGRLSGESGAEIGLQAAGRTDAGVHATGQVVAFRSRRDWPAMRWASALNAVLPEDVAVRAAQLVGVDFHPRRDATSRSYNYQVLVRRERCPLRRRTHHQLGSLALDDQLAEAWEGLVGTHDFASFCSSGSTPRSTIVTVTAATVTRRGDERLFAITARSFLYHMVRRLVGAALAVGRGVLSPADFRQFLAEPGGACRLGPTAPAHGLILTDVTYPAPWSWTADG